MAGFVGLCSPSSWGMSIVSLQCAPFHEHWWDIKIWNVCRHTVSEGWRLGEGGVRWQDSPCLCAGSYCWITLALRLGASLQKRTGIHLCVLMKASYLGHFCQIGLKSRKAIKTHTYMWRLITATCFLQPDVFRRCLKKNNTQGVLQSTASLSRTSLHMQHSGLVALQWNSAQGGNFSRRKNERLQIPERHLQPQQSSWEPCQRTARKQDWHTRQMARLPVVHVGRGD